jgi:hypothetical protein
MAGLTKDAYAAHKAAKKRKSKFRFLIKNKHNAVKSIASTVEG